LIKDHPAAFRQSSIHKQTPSIKFHQAAFKQAMSINQRASTSIPHCEKSSHETVRSQMSNQAYLHAVRAWHSFLLLKRNNSRTAK
jgi:hypothetical protein